MNELTGDRAGKHKAFQCDRCAVVVPEINEMPHVVLRGSPWRRSYRSADDLKDGSLVGYVRTKEDKQ